MSVTAPKIEIESLPLSAEGFGFTTNAYIISRNGHALLVDPAGQANIILDSIASRNLTLDGIIITHAHLDHIGALGGLAMQQNLPVYAHTKSNLTQNIPNFNAIDEGTVIKLAGESIKVIHTPGHSPDSICLLFDDKLVAGDTLFRGTCGRTDLLGGDPSYMHDSLTRLSKLNPATIVYPGHGRTTTIADELDKGLAEY